MSNTPQHHSDSLSSGPVAVLGSGAWGTALAMQLTRAGCAEVRLWGRDTVHAKEMLSARANTRYLPASCRFPDHLLIYHDLAAVLDGVRNIVIVVPSSAFCSLLQQINPYILPNTYMIWGTKGLPDKQALNSAMSPSNKPIMLLNDAVHMLIEQPVKTAVLSGPSFAIEVAQSLPTAVVVASEEQAVVTHWQNYFHCPYFRVYGSDDMVGVELGGILKNIIAVAVGAAAGLGLGSNACSALITRGLAEMQRIGQVVGARHDTLTGLSGLGDLILTATSAQSRNYRFGFALGSGSSLEQAKAASGNVIESLNNVARLCDVAQAHNITLPIITQVKKVLHGELAVQHALEALLSREPKPSE